MGQNGLHPPVAGRAQQCIGNLHLHPLDRRPGRLDAGPCLAELRARGHHGCLRLQPLRTSGLQRRSADTYARLGGIELLRRDEVLGHQFGRAFQLAFRKRGFGRSLCDQGLDRAHRLFALPHDRRQRDPRSLGLPGLRFGRTQLRLQRLRVHAADLVIGKHEVAFAHLDVEDASPGLVGHVDRRSFEPAIARDDPIGQFVAVRPAPSQGGGNQQQAQQQRQREATSRSGPVHRPGISFQFPVEKTLRAGCAARLHCVAAPAYSPSATAPATQPSSSRRSAVAGCANCSSPCAPGTLTARPRATANSKP